MMTHDTLQQHLLDLYDRHGKLTPQIVVDEARDESHPLHARYEWDDSVAAESWRREQAREDIRSVKVVVKQSQGGEEHRIRSWVSVPSNVGGPSYAPIERVAEDDFTKRLVLQQMENEWRTLKRRWSDHAEFMGMVATDLAI